MTSHLLPSHYELAYDWFTLAVTHLSPLLSSPDEREAVQKKTFTKWVNSHLGRVTCRIGDLYTDLRDGRMLIRLLEVLSGEQLVSNSQSLFICPPNPDPNLNPDQSLMAHLVCPELTLSHSCILLSSRYFSLTVLHSA